MAAGRSALISACDSLADLRGGIEALMYFSVSEHLDGTTRAALDFVQAGLRAHVEAMGTAMERALDSLTIAAPDRFAAGPA